MGQPVSGQETVELDQNMTLYYKSLLDNVTIEVYSGREKLCECTKYVFELLCLDHTVCDLKGNRIKGQVKIKATTYIPIIVID